MEILDVELSKILTLSPPAEVLTVLTVLSIQTTTTDNDTMSALNISLKMTLSSATNSEWVYEAEKG